MCLGPTAAIVEAAKARGIPTRRLNNEGLDESLVQLGHGVKQRRILSAYTDRTSSISESITQDKELTKVLLRSSGIPVPHGRPVTDVDDAWDAANELGMPVVVKPRDADYGHGVGLNLTTREQIHAAYAAAREKSEHVLVERQAQGWEFRLLIVAGKLAAAVRREPPRVVGDGTSTVDQLVAEANNDPRRGTDHTTLLKKIKVDDAALACLSAQGLNLDSVPTAGQSVQVRRNTHLWDGGTTTDVTDIVHPEVAARAIEATRIVDLDVAGIDIIADDISRPLEEQGGVILEINAAPSLKMHLEPTVGSPRPVGEAIINSMFAPENNGRIPIVAVTGVNGKTTTTRLIAHILRQTGLHLGMTCTDGIYLDGRRIETGDCAGPKSARSVLLNPKVEAAVFEVARGGILREGLGFDRCQVAVITNIGEGDHLGIADVHTLEKLALVKRTPVDVVLPEGTAVLNGADPLVAAMAPKCRGSVTFFALDENAPVLVEHRATGGRTSFARGESIVLAEGESETVLGSLAEVPLTLGGRVKFQVENVLAACAAAWAARVPFEIIRSALASFTSDMRQVPGRFNILQVRGATVVVDFGHNPSALVALTDSLGQFPHERRTVVFSADGDRSDGAILRQAEIIGNTIDRVILYEEECRNRGRAPGAIFTLVKRGLALGSRVSEVIDAEGELEAIRFALDAAQPGDLLLVLHDAVEASLAFIQNYIDTQVGTAGFPGVGKHSWAARTRSPGGPGGHRRALMTLSSGDGSVSRDNDRRSPLDRPPGGSGMEFRKVLALRGPNVWANFPVLEAWLDLGAHRGVPVHAIPGFIDRLLGWVPSLHDHECNTGHAGGLTEQLNGDTSLAHVLEHVTLEFQSLVWKPVGFGRSRETSEAGVYRVAVKYHDEQLAHACLQAARALCLAAVHNESFDCATELHKLRRLAYRVCLGPSTNAIVSAAVARGIPYRRLNSESLVQLGHGFKQRRIRTAETDRTSAISESIAQDKDLTRLLLRAVGVPVPVGRPVEDAEDAWEAAREIGAPVVVKPRFGNQGRGVATNLSTREQVVAAFAAAKEEGDSVVVERYHTGEDYRVLVVNGQLIAASKREPAQVVGDGHSTIRQLVDEVNKDPRRGEDHATALSKIVLNSIALAVLAEQGFTPESVPPPGLRVLIRRNANLSTGGTAEDVTDLVHPEVAARAIDAARVIGLDIAGIDVIAEDISRPLEEQSGVIVEVNAGPGLRMHIEPSSGKSRPVGEAIVASLFPEGENGRIPIAAVTGVNGKTTVTRLLAHIAGQSGQAGGYDLLRRHLRRRPPARGRRLQRPPKCAGHSDEPEGRDGRVRDRARRHPPRRARLRPLRRRGRDQPRRGGPPRPGRHSYRWRPLAQVKRTIVDVVTPEGAAILNADDSFVAALAPHCKGSVIYWAWSERNTTLHAHREQGGRAVFVRDGVIVLAIGSEETPFGLIAGPLDPVGAPRVPGRERPGRDRRGVGLAVAARRDPCGTFHVRQHA